MISLPFSSFLFFSLLFFSFRSSLSSLFAPTAYTQGEESGRERRRYIVRERERERERERAESGRARERESERARERKEGRKESARSTDHHHHHHQQQQQEREKKKPGFCLSRRVAFFSLPSDSFQESGGGNEVGLDFFSREVLPLREGGAAFYSCFL